MRESPMQKEQLLSQSVNKFNQFLLLLHDEYSTWTGKQTATKTFINEATEKAVEEVIKKWAKTTSSPQRMYTGVE